MTLIKKLPLLFILSGPSASGKTTLYNSLKKKQLLKE